MDTSMKKMSWPLYKVTYIFVWCFKNWNLCLIWLLFLCIPFKVAHVFFRIVPILTIRTLMNSVKAWSHWEVPYMRQSWVFKFFFSFHLKEKILILSSFYIDSCGFQVGHFDCDGLIGKRNRITCYEKDTNPRNWEKMRYRRKIMVQYLSFSFS